MAKILVYRIGSLGDTLVALPALWRIRDHYRDAEIHLLCDRQASSKYVLASELLKSSGAVDEFHTYPVAKGGFGKLIQPLRRLGLIRKLRSYRFDKIIYLAPSARTPTQIRRDSRFFALCGIRERIGFLDLHSGLPREQSPLPNWPREADLLEKRLDGAIPPASRRRFDLGIGESERAEVATWSATRPPDGGRPWIAVAPGSKMPAKIWPVELYIEVVNRLIAAFDIWPVVFGDRAERPIAERCVASWGRGSVAAGELGLRPAVAALEKCRLYLGNDTGTMHMAASAGVPCAAVFCSHAPPGQWYPIGEGHRVFRTPIDCEGCGLSVCIDRKMECIRSIGVEEVAAGCEEILRKSAGLAPNIGPGRLSLA